jgi:hypothetical protein
MSEASTMPNTPEPDADDAMFCDDKELDLDDILGEGYFDVELHDLEAMKAEFMRNNSSQVRFHEAAGAYFAISDLKGLDSQSIETDEP